MSLRFFGFDRNTGNYIEEIASCTVADTGNFSIPADLFRTLQDYPNNFKVRYSRNTQRIDVVDGVVFRQRTVIAENI